MNGKIRDNRTSEKWLERALVDFVEAHGGAAIKIATSTVNSLPDRVVLWPGGATEFVELKSSGCKQTPAQHAIFRALTRMGFRCTVIDSEKSLYEWQSLHRETTRAPR